MTSSSVSLALVVSAIALPDSLNPSLIGVAIYLAARPNPRRQTAAFAAGAFAITLGGGVLLALGLGDLILSVVPKPSRTVKYALEIAAGVLLVIAAAGTWWRRRALASGTSHRNNGSTGTGSAAVLGAGIAGLELLTAFPYFAAIAIVADASVSDPTKLFLLFLYDVVYLLPVLLIVAMCFVIGQRAGRVLAPVGGWINANWPMVVAPIAAAVGVALITYGIVHLT